MSPYRTSLNALRKRVQDLEKNQIESTKLFETALKSSTWCSSARVFECEAREYLFSHSLRGLARVTYTILTLVIVSYPSLAIIPREYSIINTRTPTLEHRYNYKCFDEKPRILHFKMNPAARAIKEKEKQDRAELRAFAKRSESTS